MKTKLALVAGFILAYLTFVICQIPANIAVGWFPLPNNIAVGKVSGSIWQPEISAVDVEGVVINNIDAELSALSLLLLSPSIDANFGGPLLSGPKGHISGALSQQSQTLTDSKIEISANEIVPFLLLPIEVEAFGQVTLTVGKLALEQGKCISAQGTLQWQRAAVSALEQDIELGSFQGNIHCQGEKLAITLNDKNKLGLNYTATIDAQGRITGNGFILPGGDFPQQLKEALPFIGNPDARGRYLLKM